MEVSMFKVGETVAVHYKNDRVINETLAFGNALFDYSKHSSFKRCEVLKVKRHWNWFFKTMFFLSDGFWYSQKQLTPIVRVCAGHRIDHIGEANDLGDNSHIENHVSPLCKMGVK